MNTSDLLTAQTPVARYEFAGVAFFLKRWSVKERLDWLRSIKGKGIEDDQAALALVMSVCDEAGQLLLTREQIPQLVASNNEFSSPILAEVLTLNGITDDRRLEKKAN